MMISRRITRHHRGQLTQGTQGCSVLYCLAGTLHHGGIGHQTITLTLMLIQGKCTMLYSRCDLSSTCCIAARQGLLIAYFCRATDLSQEFEREFVTCTSVQRKHKNCLLPMPRPPKPKAIMHAVVGQWACLAAQAGRAVSYLLHTR